MSQMYAPGWHGLRTSKRSMNIITQKCRATFEALTDEKADQRCEFPWGEELSFAELQLYRMRHVQEHASQLSLPLWHQGVAAPDWVARAKHKTT